MNNSRIKVSRNTLSDIDVDLDYGQAYYNFGLAELLDLDYKMMFRNVSHNGYIAEFEIVRGR